MAAVVRNEEFRRLTADGLRILAVAAVYYWSGRVGLLQRVVVAGAVVTPLWPPTGIALACLLYMGIRIWPGIALGAFFIVLTISPLNLADIGIIGGNTFAPVCAFLMLRRVGFRVEFDRLRDGLALVFLGALGGMVVSATVGTGVLLFNGALPAHGFWPAWSAWWTGDAMGVLVVTPLLLAIAAFRLPRETGPFRWAEAAALLLCTAGGAFLATRASVSVLFLVFPLLIWAALRFQLIGAAPCALIVSVLAITAATGRIGPFAHHGLFAVMVTLQALNGSAALTSLLLAAVITEQINVRRKIEQACDDLAEVVDRLAPGGAVRRWRRSDDGIGDSDGWMA